MQHFQIEERIFKPAYEAFLRHHDLRESSYAKKDFIRYLLKREKINIYHAEKLNDLKKEYKVREVIKAGLTIQK